MTGEEYASRFQKAVEQLGDISKRDAQQIPLTGVRVTKVLKDGAGSSLGILDDDIITRIDHKIPWTNQLAYKGDRSQVIEVVTPSTGESRTLTIGPGYLEIFTQFHWRPDLAYLRGKSRSPKWDRDVLIGITSAAGLDADLAETCWYHALKKGYVPDVHAAAAGVEISLAQGRHLAASQFVLATARADFARGESVHPVPLYRAALASNQLLEARRILEEYPDFSPTPHAKLQQLIDAHRQHPQEKSPPSVLAAEMYHENVVPHLRGYSLNGIENFLPVLIRGEHCLFQANPDQFTEMSVICPELTTDCEVTIKFTLEMMPGDDNKFYKQLQLALIDSSASLAIPQLPGQSQYTLVHCQLRDQQVVALSHSRLPGQLSYIDPRLKFDANTEHEVRLIRVGSQGQIFLNGNCILHVPVEAAPKPAFYLKAIGCKAVIRKLTFDELIERP